MNEDRITVYAVNGERLARFYAGAADVVAALGEMTPEEIVIGFHEQLCDNNGLIELIGASYAAEGTKVYTAARNIGLVVIG